MKLKNTNCDKNSKNSNCDKTQKFKLRQNSKIQIVTKLKNSKCYKTLKKNSDFDKTQKLKLRPN